MLCIALLESEAVDDVNTPGLINPSPPPRHPPYEDVKIEELTIGARCSVKKKKSAHNLTAYVLRRGNSMDDSYGNPAFWTSVGQGKGERSCCCFFLYIKKKLQKKKCCNRSWLYFVRAGLLANTAMARASLKPSLRHA